MIINRWKNKSAAILFMLTAALILTSSCGYKEAEGVVENHKQAGTENASEPEKSKEEAVQEKTPEEILETAPEAGLNQTVAVHYGEAFSDCGLSVSGDMLYMDRSAPDENSFYIAEIPEAGQQIPWISIGLPDHMAVRMLTTDYQDKYHVLLMKMGMTVIEDREFYVPTYEVSYIWTINREGEVERKLDISDLFAEEQRTPTCFITDLEGNYYFDIENKIYRFNPDSGITMKWSCEGYEIEALACGKSGKIYCIYEDYQGVDVFERLEEDGIKDICISLPNYGCKYDCMAAGLDTELLIFNMEGGMYAYADGADTVKQRISKKDMPVSGENAAIHEILCDGRLWIRVYDKETKGCTFYYIPTAVEGGNE
ncbi:MAG: hypothetical protein NC429_04930 [Lachnospiraceae bacterium]|nr:hypothetical protein [Lachnospiraceae bacterium]